MVTKEISFTVFTFIQLLHITLARELIPNDERVIKASEIALSTANNLYGMFELCVDTPMPNQQFLTDDIHNFLNYPMKTTVGFSPKFTSNRRFFANMIGTPAFKDILAKDVNEIRMALLKKMKYCDEAIMDQQILRDFYDHEVDQSKV